MATTSDFRNGLCFNFNGKLVKIIEFQHVKPGKGPAFVRTKLRNLENGKVLTNTFISATLLDLIIKLFNPAVFFLSSHSLIL